MMLIRLLTTLTVVALGAAALGQRQCIVFPNDDDRSSSTRDHYLDAHFHTPDFIIATRGVGAVPILVDSSDDPAVHVAVRTFADDVERVTGVRPRVYNDTLPTVNDPDDDDDDDDDDDGTVTLPSVIIVGSIGRSESVVPPRPGLSGLWEAYDIRVERVGEVEGLVVAGSDRRGTIYGLYDLSEQMGVSPWYFWADVPVLARDSVGFRGECAHAEPTVKYRGIFFNDELPVLWGWARARWNYTVSEPPFQTGLYELTFELVLRLRGNYVWPAMWASAFDVDGLDVSDGHLPPIPTSGPNQDLAQRMGVVMGTSHHEPMTRNKEEWDRWGRGDWDWTNAEFLTDWWKYGAERARGHETLFTMGMRGDGDLPLTGGTPELVENITAVQQGILRDVYNHSVPQMWCMYKEVSGYYKNGLKVPDDVTIMFSDDNWGNIMSVLEPGKDHPAGAGLYYHADYVGFPRDYKWINTVSMAKTWEQLNHARAFNTTQIWILNIGDLKMLELPVEHFMSIAYDADQWPRNSVTHFLTLWARREFPNSEHASEIARIMALYSMYSSRLKSELVDAGSWSLTNYDEAERVLDEWDTLESRAQAVYDTLDEPWRPTYIQLVLVPIQLQSNLNKLHVAVARSNLYAVQARTSTNIFARVAMDAFWRDFEITETYHSLLDRKWDHMLDQTHINYQNFLEPVRDSLPAVSWVNPHQPTRLARETGGTYKGLVAHVRFSVENSRGAWPGDTRYNCLKGYNCPPPTLLPMDRYGARTRWIDVASGGPLGVTFTATPDVPWLTVSPGHGTIAPDGSSDMRLYVSVDWDTVEGDLFGKVHLVSSDGSNLTVTVPVHDYSAPDKGYSGFVQGDGYVVIESEHFAHQTSASGYGWEQVDGYGRTLSGLEMLPSTTQNFTLGRGPSVTYTFWTHDRGDANVTLQLGPSNNFMLGKELALGFQLDDLEPIEIHPIPNGELGSVELSPGSAPLDIGAVPPDWIAVVSTEIRNSTIPINVDRPGPHSITLWGMTTGLVVERVWVDFGGIKARGYSYLGPPESRKV